MYRGIMARLASLKVSTAVCIQDPVFKTQLNNL
jgi:hypothetical protein